MSKALYILQRDCELNATRLDECRRVVDLLVKHHELGDPLKDYMKEVYKLQKLLKYTGVPS